MLGNSLHCIPMNAWILNYDFALILMKTAKCRKTVKAMGDRWKTFYDENQPFSDLPTPDLMPEDMGFDDDIFTQSESDAMTMSINHVLAVLFYCNFHRLSLCLRASYVATDGGHGSKERHSELANLGRLVRDSVEDYGQAVGASTAKRFYHGLDGHRIVFNTTMIRFCSPISCSSSYDAIGLYLDSQRGLILECKEYSKYLRFLCVEWLSLQSAENEMVFCGGDWPLKMHSILDVAVSSYNYRHYLCAINILQDLIRGEYNHECEHISSKIQLAFNQIFSSRLWMRDAIPKYVDRLFDAYCENLGESIEINFEFVDAESSGYREIKSSFVETVDDVDRIKVDVLCCVFCNVPIFKFLSYRLCHQTFQFLLSFLGQRQHQTLYDSKLKYMIFASPNQSRLKCKDVLKVYKKKFAKIGWFLEFKKKDQFGQPVLLIAHRRIKMDECVIM